LPRWPRLHKSFCIFDGCSSGKFCFAGDRREVSITGRQGLGHLDGGRIVLGAADPCCSGRKGERPNGHLRPALYILRLHLSSDAVSLLFHRRREIWRLFEVFWSVFRPRARVFDLSRLAEDRRHRASTAILAIFIACPDRHRLVARCFWDLGKHFRDKADHRPDPRGCLRDVYDACACRNYAKSDAAGPIGVEMSRRHRNEKKPPSGRPFSSKPFFDKDL
jgi:hypothetical protein